MSTEEPKWFKSKGYVHLTSKVDVYSDRDEYLAKIHNPDFVAKHSFFPLIHYAIKERKYKKHPNQPDKRVHSYKDDKGKYKPTAKHRPIHFATHIDAMIFGCYAEILAYHYDSLLNDNPKISESVIAYRKIPILGDPRSRNKSTINFAQEAFSEILKKSKADSCCVLMFDIKSFFSELNHDYLKQIWAKALGISGKLPPDHYNVFKAATNFSYVLRDELRMVKGSYGKRSGFNEKQLHLNRKSYGAESYFSSLYEFRKAIKDGSLKIYNRQFTKKGNPVGIPQGLPISSVLANLYLLHFDEAMIKQIVEDLGGYYRRYSDDILIICKSKEAERIKSVVRSELRKCHLDPSEDKTEHFILKPHHYGKKGEKLTSFQVLKSGEEKIKPITYLGFQFYGYQTRIKSSNLAKFHRKIIDSVKRKTKRIQHIVSNCPHTNSAIFVNQIRKLSTSIKKGAKGKPVNLKRLKLSPIGTYQYQIKEFEPKYKSNYISYVRRASKVFDDPGIYNQISKRKRILHEALNLHYTRKIGRFINH